MKSLVMRQRLEGRLSIRLVSELNENTSDRLRLSLSVFCLRSCGSRDKLLQSLAGPVDRVNFLAVQTKFAELVGWSLLLRDPAGSKSTRFSIALSHWFWLCFRVSASLLDSLQSLLVGKLDKLDFGRFQDEGSLVTFLNELVDLGGVTSDPDASNSVTKDLSKLELVKIRLGNRCEEHCSGRDAVRVDWREKERLTQVDVEDALTCDQHQHEAKKYPSTETVSEVSVLPTALVLVDVAHGKHVQLLLPSAASDVDREQDWHGNASADKHDDHSHAKKSKK